MTALPDPDTSWMVDALCKEIGGDFWHPEKGQFDIVQIAKRVCNMCPVKQECLTHALDVGEPHGIWGGVTAVGRARMGMNRRRRPFPHGTPAGYRRHHRENTTPCAQCRRADILDRQERKWNGS